MKRQEEINEIRSMLNELRGNSEQNFQYAKDDIIEYQSLTPQLTGLDYEIYIDDGYSYINHNHPIWLYVVGDNGNIVTITVEDTPRVINGNVNELTNVEDIFAFIEEYKQELIDIAEDKITSTVLFRTLKQKKMVAENLALINEMARIPSKETGLSCDIYLDNSKIHSGHEGSPHLKFPPNPSYNRNTNSWVPMSISHEPNFYKKDMAKFDSLVSGKTKKQIQNFI